MRWTSPRGVGAVLLSACLVLMPLAAADPKAPPGLGNKGPLCPREEQATFKIARGFKIELAASEPTIIDPVAMAFDGDGKLYVAEMRGYPNAGVGTGTVTSGKIKLLEDSDGDGIYDRSTVFAEGLRLPMSVLPWKGGLLVAVAPDIIYLEDTNGDGKADRKRVLYTGFNLSNIQQMVNGFTWGMDNWVYGIAGNNGGTIHSPEKPDMPPITLRARGFRFHPGVPGSLEPTSGGGQYGLTADTWGRWFTATNSQHLRHIVLPDHALRRNPNLAVRAVTLDIPDHGAACKVYRISPFEAWRVERTRRRKEGPGASRFSSTELVPGGYSTSTCCPLVYDATLFPKEYRGNILVCDPANNLIHRDILQEKGATFTARRGDIDCEFLASTDNWFRPVWLSLGPDGAVYVLDFYREVIETPLSLPDDIKKRVNLESRGRGRIWRIVPKEFKRPTHPALNQAPLEKLVAALASDNAWYRLTAQRLLFERQDKSAVPALKKLARDSQSAPGRIHALWALDGLDALPDSLVEKALRDSEPGAREQALRLAEKRLPHSPDLFPAVIPLADDSSPRVRFQLAITLGASNSPKRLGALARILLHPESDSWTRTAVLSSSRGAAGPLLEAVLTDKAFRKSPAQYGSVLGQLASLAIASARDAEVSRLLGLATPEKGYTPAAWQQALLEGLGEGLRDSRRTLSALLEKPPQALKKAAGRLRPVFEETARTARSDGKPLAERIDAARLLGYGPYSVAGVPLQELLSPRVPPELQLAAIRALGRHEGPSVSRALLSAWPGYSPTVRRECLEALFARTDRLNALLDALEKKSVLVAHIEPARLELLRRHRDPAVRARARKILVGQVAPDRQKIVAAFREALDLKADRARGKMLFQKNCATCHRLQNVGFEVGADLNAALKNKTPEQLVIDILDPSREVDPRYQNYLLTTRKGQSLSGLIAAETASSITLRRGEKAEDVVLRTQIDDITATGKSLMPDGLEAQLKKQDLADLIEYLLSTTR
jgi:putative membrane-bound dehydrogenase-like protein